MVTTLTFDYDRWANARWLAYLDGHEHGERGREILRHHLSALLTWHRRIQDAVSGSSQNPASPDDDLAAGFDHVYGAWAELIASNPPETIIDYQTFAGEPYRNTIGQIVAHGLNHGTYHRGQIRGLMEAFGRNDFPDTDFIMYARES